MLFSSSQRKVARGRQALRVSAQRYRIKAPWLVFEE